MAILYKSYYIGQTTFEILHDKFVRMNIEIKINP